MRKLDEYLEMYLYLASTDNKRMSPEESSRIDALLKEREQALGLTSEQLATLFPLIDAYEKDETAYEAIHEQYERLRK